MEYDYGDHSRGRSYEYFNFYQSLLQTEHQVSLFDFLEETKKSNKIEMNRKLFDLVATERPDITFFSIFNDELDSLIVKKLSEYTKTVCFFHDDTWRVGFTLKWARSFDFFTTPDFFGERKYKLLGFKNSIHFPFGCNENIYYKIDTKKKYDVSFVGSWHPQREWLVNRLKKCGFSVKVAGHGWSGGVVAHKEMVKIFNQSRINLNLSNSTTWDVRYIASSLRAIVNTIRSPKVSEQIKARHFEINGCGGFQLTYYVQGLEKYYEIGKEIDVYLGADDLEKKVFFYLRNPNLIKEISGAGMRRTLKEHLFKHRFKVLFNRIGLK
jgi:spore maturation protein CgeB